MIILCNILLPNHRAHTIPDENGKIIKPTQVLDKVIEVDVAPIITIVSTFSNIVLRVLSFLIYDCCL